MLNTLKTYKLQLEKVTGKVMVYVQTDNAPEFKGSLWTGYFTENGLMIVLPHHTPPDPTELLNGQLEFLLVQFE